MKRFLIHNARILSMDPAIGEMPKGDILIEDGKIAAIAPELNVEVPKTISADRMIAMPGLVDTHRHVWQTLIRGLAADWTLFDYMARIRYGLAPHFTAEDAYLANYAGHIEALNAGITTIADHAHLVATPAHSEGLVRGMLDAGIRGIFCYGLSDVADAGGRIDTARNVTSTWRYDDAKRIRTGLLAGDTGRVRFGIGASEFLFFPMQYTAREVGLARDLEAARFSVHAANGVFTKNSNYVGRMAKAGLIDETTLLVHGNWMSATEMAQAADCGAALAVTPESELQMGMGYPAFTAARAAGIKTGLGVDIVSGSSPDLFTQMRLSLAAERVRANDRLANSGIMPRSLEHRADTLLRAATIEGAAALGLDGITGSLTPGKAADIILIRTDEPGYSPIGKNPAAHVAMQTGTGSVDTVIADGVIRKTQGKLVDTDMRSLNDKLETAAQRIQSAADNQGYDDAEAYVGNVFPLDKKSARMTRLAARAMRVPGMDRLIFKAFLRMADKR